MYMNISNEIKNRRCKLKITQADLSEISGVSLRTIKGVEKGDANPTIDIVERLLRPLGLSLAVRERVDNG